MDIHEYQAKEILIGYGVKIAKREQFSNIKLDCLFIQRQFLIPIPLYNKYRLNSISVTINPPVIIKAS